MDSSIDKSKDLENPHDLGVHVVNENICPDMVQGRDHAYFEEKETLTGGKGGDFVDLREKVGFVSTADDRTSFMSTDSSEETSLPSNDSTDNVSVVVRLVNLFSLFDTIVYFRQIYTKTIGKAAIRYFPLTRFKNWLIKNITKFARNTCNFLECNISNSSFFWTFRPISVPIQRTKPKTTLPKFFLRNRAVEKRLDPKKSKDSSGVKSV